MKETNTIHIVLIAVLVVAMGVIGYMLLGARDSATGMYSVAGSPEVKTCVAGNIDNCPDDYNPDQKDSDGDGKGDVCDDEYNPPAEPQGCELDSAPPQFSTNAPAQYINVPVQSMPQPITGAAAKEKQDSSLLVALAAVVMLLVLLMGITSIFKDKIRTTYHRVRAKMKFHLKR